VGWCGGVCSFTFQFFNSSIYGFSDFNFQFSIFKFVGYGGFDFHVCFIFVSISHLLRNTFNFQFSISIFNFEDSESTTVLTWGEGVYELIIFDSFMIEL